MLPDPIKKFVDIFAKLPSIGPRQATRLAFYIASLGKEKTKEIANAVAGLDSLIFCSRCFRTHHGKNGLCSICDDSTRQKNIIAVVEKETDILSLEKTKKYNGWYLMVGELSKLGELEPEQKLRLSSLKSFIKKELGGQAAEIILATNPNTFGDISASTLKKELESHAEKITRLGRGIPTGGEIEFADEDTLASALDRRI